MNRPAAMFALAVLAILIGLALVFPAIAQLRQTGVLPTVGVGLLQLGLVLTLGGLALVVRGARARFA